MLGKNTNAERVKTTAGYIFSKYVHCDMRFLVVKTRHWLAFLTVLVLLPQYFFITNNKLCYYLNDDFIRWWPTKWCKII